jgi:hypothetical protein
MPEHKCPGARDADIVSRRHLLILLILTPGVMIADLGPAAAAQGPDGAAMGWPWMLPFIGCC